METEYFAANGTFIDNSNYKYRDLYKELHLVKKVCGIWNNFEIWRLVYTRAGLICVAVLTTSALNIHVLYEFCLYKRTTMHYEANARPWSKYTYLCTEQQPCGNSQQMSVHLQVHKVEGYYKCTRTDTWLLHTGPRATFIVRHPKGLMAWEVQIL